MSIVSGPTKHAHGRAVGVAAVLVSLLGSVGLLAPEATASEVLRNPGQVVPRTAPAHAAVLPADIPGANALTPRGTGTAFGVVVPGFPRSDAARRAAIAAVGARSDIVEYFASATHPLDVGLLDTAGRDGATPLLSLETYDWPLAEIAAGRYDEQIKRLAAGFASYQHGAGGTVLVRFDHEMNGDWYPWSEGRNGNRPGAYAQAWRHVVDLMRSTGTGRTTVRWVWAPNVLRGADPDTMQSAYPGDTYVDYVGLTGYGASAYERTPADTFDKTLAVLRARVSASKPIIIAESGAGPGKYKEAWTRALGGWLLAHPDVRAFVWFDTDPTTGANDDWRFTPYPDVTAALRASLRQVAAAP